MRPSRSGMHNVRSVGWTHGMEIMASTIGVVMTWHAVVVISVTGVVSVNAEAPSIVSKHDWTIEVVVRHITCPLGGGKQTTESQVTVIQHIVVLCIGVAISQVVKILVHTIDVVEVNHIHCVDDVCPQTECEYHAVGEETCVVAHHSVRHGLGVQHICHCQHHYCYKQCFLNRSHSRYGFVESVGVCHLTFPGLILLFLFSMQKYNTFQAIAKD